MNQTPGLVYMHSGYMCKITDNIWKIYFFLMFLRCRDNVLLSTCPFSIFRFHVLVVFIYIYIVKGLFGFYFGICKDANLLFCCLALILSQLYSLNIASVIPGCSCLTCSLMIIHPRPVVLQKYDSLIYFRLKISNHRYIEVNNLRLNHTFEI